jgi:hypothetical protein
MEHPLRSKQQTNPWLFCLAHVLFPLFHLRLGCDHRALGLGCEVLPTLSGGLRKVIQELPICPWNFPKLEVLIIAARKAAVMKSRQGYKDYVIEAW